LSKRRNDRREGKLRRNPAVRRGRWRDPRQSAILSPRPEAADAKFLSPAACAVLPML